MIQKWGNQSFMNLSRPTEGYSSTVDCTDLCTVDVSWQERMNVGAHLITNAFYPCNTLVIRTLCERRVFVATLSASSQGFCRMEKIVF